MSRHIFKKRHTAVGARPGTLMISEQSPIPKISTIHYSEKTCTEKPISNLEELNEAFNSDGMTWIDVQGFGDSAVIQRIGEIFQFHPLLLEDVINVPQRPKTEPYGDQLLVIVRMVSLDPHKTTGDPVIQTEQVSLVIGKNYLITFQEKYGDILDPVRLRIKGNKGLMRTRGPDYLAYAISDTIIDGYYPVLEVIGNRLERMEDIVIRNPIPRILVELHDLKNQLINLRRSIWPQREAINSLVRGDHAIITPEVGIYLRDTYNHCIQTSEVAEMYREMVSGLMNTYLSSIANRTNEVMKVLTIMASIFIPLTFMAGIYGMNFDHMPELHYKYSYSIFWMVMIATALGMIAYFWRKGWIGNRSR